MYFPPCANEAVIAKWTGAVPWFLDALHVTRTSANLPTGATQGRANVAGQRRAAFGASVATVCWATCTDQGLILTSLGPIARSATSVS